ncbi:MAG: hypothetical protein ACPG8W_00160 [Candidatus Promineifilaceae bacterium]
MEHKAPQLSRISQKQLLVDKFLTWMPASDATAWLRALSATEQATAIHEIAAFCQDAGFELSWVVENQIGNEQLADLLKQSVLRSVETLHSASIAQPLLTTYTALVKWLNNPIKRGYRKQTRQIYIRLVEQGVIANADAAILLNSDKLRWDYVQKALLTAYREDAAAVESAVQAIIVNEPEAAETPQRAWWYFSHRITIMPIGIVETALVLTLARGAQGRIRKRRRRKRRRQFFHAQRSLSKQESQ